MVKIKTTKPKKPKYDLIVQIGKDNQSFKRKVFKGIPESDNYEKLVEKILTIESFKIMQGVKITLKFKGKKAERFLPSFKARLCFNNKLNAFFLFKNLHVMFK